MTPHELNAIETKCWGFKMNISGMHLIFSFNPEWIYLTRKYLYLPLFNYMSYFYLLFKYLFVRFSFKSSKCYLFLNFRFWFYPGLHHIATILCPLSICKIHQKSTLLLYLATYILMLKGFCLVGWTQIMRILDMLYGKILREVRTWFLWINYCKL
jgi:hypothetical protein